MTAQAAGSIPRGLWSDTVAITREHVLQALSTVPVDAGGTNLVASGACPRWWWMRPAGSCSRSRSSPPRPAAMEPVRQAAETAVRGLPGVKGVFASLTADRPAAKGPRDAAFADARPAGARALAEGPAHPRRHARHRGRVRQRRRRQVHHRLQPRARRSRRTGSRSAFSTPTSTVRRCRSFSGSTASRASSRGPHPRAAWRATASRSCPSASWSRKRRR